MLTTNGKDRLEVAARNYVSALEDLAKQMKVVEGFAKPTANLSERLRNAEWAVHHGRKIEEYRVEALKRVAILREAHEWASDAGLTQPEFEAITKLDANTYEPVGGGK